MGHIQSEIKASLPGWRKWLTRAFCALQEFILNQDWNDPKSQLQQCCLTLRTEGKEPDIPLYK